MQVHFLDSQQSPDPVVIVPCVFMIGENGVPLEVSGGYISPSELAHKFDKVLQVSGSHWAIQRFYAQQQELL